MKQGPLPAALADLTGAIQRLDSLVTTDEDRADVQLLQIIAARLNRFSSSEAIAVHPSGLQQFEPGRLRRLLELAGPKHSAELLARLGEDLVATRAKLAASATSQDWPALHEASHVLISLSGSVGAISLQHLSERVNAMGQTNETHGLADLMAVVLAELDALTTIIVSTKPEAGL